MASFITKKRKYKRTTFHADGTSTTELFPAPVPKRLRKSENVLPSSGEPPEEAVVVEPDVCKDPVHTDDIIPEGRVHNSVSFWEKIKGKMMNTYHVMCGPPEAGQQCTMCQTEEASITCDDCNVADVMCLNCAVNFHKNRFHKLKEWKNGHPTDLPLTVVCRHASHPCKDAYTKNIDVYDDKGRHHNAAVQFCSCEPEACTLLRYKLWTATRNPRRAVHLDLLSFFHYSIMECQISLHSACQMLRLKCGLSASQASALYRELVSGSMECWEDFHQSLLHEAVPLSDLDTTCPACPKEDGEVIISIDANFGLVRRCKAGKSGKPPKQGMFLADEEVKNFVNVYNDRQAQKEECSQFQAGHLVRSKKKNAALDVKGVFAAVCKHGFPLAAMNLFHGERLAYPVRIINHLLDQLNETTKIHVIYDIGCMLHKHLQNTGQTELLSRTHLSVPAFHAYGHKPSCQIKYGVRFQEGIGLCDGEGVERLWSFLRRFASMTKEMAPTKRVNTLNRALLHYAYKKQEILGTSLCKNLRQATKTLERCEKELSEICTNYSVTERDIETWSELMAKESQKSSVSYRSSETTDETYVQMLTGHFQLMQASADESQRKKLRRSEKKLSKFERKHKIATRWSMDDQRFKAAKEKIRQRQELHALKNLKSAVAERLYVKELLRKYAIGQAVAIRLSKEMNSRTKAVHKALRAYNAVSQRTLEFEEATNPDAAIYSSLVTTPQSPMQVPRSVQHSGAMAFVKRRRAVEEVEMIGQEMNRVLEWKVYQIEIHERELIGLLDREDTLSSGLRVFINERIRHLQNQCEEFREMFEKSLSC